MSLTPSYDLFSLGLEAYADHENIMEKVDEIQQFFNNSQCTCRKSKNNKDLRACFEKVGFKQFFVRHFEFSKLNKQQLDFTIKGQLMAFIANNEKSTLESESSKKTHMNYRYSYNSSLNLCVNTYLKMVGITKYYLEVLQQDLQKNGLNKRIHRNTGRVLHLSSKVTITAELKESVKTFISEYAQIHGLPSPLRHRTDSMAFIYLPTSTTYKFVYDKYKAAIL